MPPALMSVADCKIERITDKKGNRKPHELISWTLQVSGWPAVLDKTKILKDPSGTV